MNHDRVRNRVGGVVQSIVAACSAVKGARKGCTIFLSREGMAVLYTSHYMEEAERLCDRVGILDEGQLKAEGTRRELVAMVGEHDRLRLGTRGEVTSAVEALRAIPAVIDATASDGAIDLLVRDARAALAEIVRAAAEASAEIETVEVAEPNLEAVFLHLTGRARRDEG